VRWSYKKKEREDYANRNSGQDGGRGSQMSSMIITPVTKKLKKIKRGQSRDKKIEVSADWDGGGGYRKILTGGGQGNGKEICQGSYRLLRADGKKKKFRSIVEDVSSCEGMGGKT